MRKSDHGMLSADEVSFEYSVFFVRKRRKLCQETNLKEWCSLWWLSSLQYEKHKRKNNRRKEWDIQPIWVVVITEFILAYTLEVTVGSPLSFKLACKVFDPRETHPVLFETAIICATVGIMCPAMSFLAAFLYYPYYAGFNVLTLLANWIKLVCFNFPFAFFSQLFFIQPLIRTCFKAGFRRKAETAQAVKEWTLCKMSFAKKLKIWYNQYITSSDPA